MNRKILFVILLVLTFALTVTLTACDTEPLPEQHTHTYEEKWSSDGDNHWHKATCEHSDQISDGAPHKFEAVTGGNGLRCTVCGYFKASPVNPHVHTYEDKWSSDENGHWYAAACEHADAITVIPHRYTDGVCSECGWWSSASEVILANLAKSDVWSYALLLDNVRLNDVNLLSEGLEHAEFTVSGELKLSLNPDGQIEGCGYFDVGDQPYEAAVKGGVVYACSSDGYFRCSLDELLKQNGIDVQSFIGELNAKTQQIRDGFNQAKLIVDSLPVDGAAVNGLLQSIFKKDEAISSDSLTAYVPDTALLLKLSQALASTDCEHYVNELLAKLSGTPLGVLLGDSCSGLPDKVYLLLTDTILKTNATLKANGFDLDDLFDQIDAIIAKYYPNENVNNIDELLPVLGIDMGELGKKLNINLNGVSVRQLVDAVGFFSPETLWNAMQKDSSSYLDAEAISAKLQEYVDEYGNKTVYDLIAGHLGLTADYVKSLADNAIGLLSDTISAVFYVDGKVLQQVTLSCVGTDVTYEQEEIEQLKQLLESFGGAVTLKRGYELERDYSQLIDKVNAYYDSLDLSANA